MFCSDLFEVGRLLNIYKLDEKASVVMEKFKGSSGASNSGREQKVQGLSVDNIVDVSKILVKGHETEVVPAFRFCFCHKVSGLLEGKLEWLIYSVTVIRAASTREKTVWLMHPSSLLLLFCCLCY